MRMRVHLENGFGFARCLGACLQLVLGLERFRVLQVPEVWVPSPRESWVVSAGLPCFPGSRGRSRDGALGFASQADPPCRPRVQTEAARLQALGAPEGQTESGAQVFTLFSPWAGGGRRRTTHWRGAPCAMCLGDRLWAQVTGA